MNRQEQYAQIRKLSFAVKRMLKGYSDAKKIFECKDFPWHEKTKPLYEAIMQNMEEGYMGLLKWDYLSKSAAFEFKRNKPERFTPEQLKEMRYLFSEGVTKTALSRKYKSDVKTIYKFLAIKEPSDNESSDDG
jgi:hypothetical protein